MIANYRPATAADRQFIVSEWSRSYKQSHHAGFILMDQYAEVMHKQVHAALDRPHVRTLVACDPDDLTFLYGFITVDTSLRPPLVYFVAVKEPYRRSGYALGLFKAAGVDHTKQFVYACKTAWCSSLAKKIPFASWKPILARYGRPKLGAERDERDS